MTQELEGLEDGNLCNLITAKLSNELNARGKHRSLFLTISFGTYIRPFALGSLQFTLSGAELHTDITNGEVPLETRDPKVKASSRISSKNDTTERIYEESKRTTEIQIKETFGARQSNEKMQGREITKDFMKQSIIIRSFGPDRKPVWSFSSTMDNNSPIKEGLVDENIGTLLIHGDSCKLNARFRIQMWNVNIINMVDVLPVIPTKLQLAVIGQLLKANIVDTINNLCHKEVQIS